MRRSGRNQPPATRPRHEIAWVAALFLAHLGLVLWGAVRSSVTYDENFHVPAGVMIAARGDFSVSPVNPPLVKALCGWAALAAGARLPSPESLASGDQALVGESFMRRNAAHYQRVFVAARMVILLLSLVLGLLVWSFARRLYGPRAGLLALGFYVLAPEALAHGGLATMDVATGLGMFASVYAFWAFTRTGRWRWWIGTALAVGFTFLVRFTAVVLVPVLLISGVIAAWKRGSPRARIALGLLLLVPATLLALNLGYGFRTSFLPLSWAYVASKAFIGLRAHFPDLRLPLPDAYLLGLDWQAHEAQAGNTPTYLLGVIHPGPVWYYFPVAFLFKWPLGFLAALAARIAGLFAGPAPRRRHEGFLLIPVVLLLLSGMFLVSLDTGVRYLFPILPFLCVWLGGWMLPLDRPRSVGRSWPRRWAPIAVGLAILQGGEAIASAPWYLSFFNLAAGGPGRGDRVVNDSNVDWGQGLNALREAMNRFQIRRIHLAYHGTADPGVYGIDYVIYRGGPIGPESDWIAVSSYYFVGLPQRMMTPTGRIGPMKYDFTAFRTLTPVARPAGCMYLFRVGH